MSDLRNKLYTLATTLGLCCATVAVAALLLDKTVPYRIGPEQYWRYLWSERLAGLSLGIGAATLVLGLISLRGWRPIGLAFTPLVFLIFMGGVHSGPIPEWWCYLNLIAIDDGKERFALQYKLTNGTIVTKGELLPYIERGAYHLKCAVGGSYSINSVGFEPRCSIHGSISEMDTKSKTKALPSDTSNPHSPSAHGADGR